METGHGQQLDHERVDRAGKLGRQEGALLFGKVAS